MRITQLGNYPLVLYYKLYASISNIFDGAVEWRIHDAWKVNNNNQVKNVDGVKSFVSDSYIDADLPVLCRF